MMSEGAKVIDAYGADVTDPELRQMIAEDIEGAIYRAILATQEKCAQWHEEMAGSHGMLANGAVYGDRAYHLITANAHRESASAIRSLKLTETGQ